MYFQFRPSVGRPRGFHVVSGVFKGFYGDFWGVPDDFSSVLGALGMFQEVSGLQWFSYGSRGFQDV